jgi:hypothetical protein
MMVTISGQNIAWSSIGSKNEIITVMKQQVFFFAGESLKYLEIVFIFISQICLRLYLKRKNKKSVLKGYFIINKKKQRNF